MKQKYSIAIIIVIVAASLVAGFSLLSFRAISSQTGRDSSLASSTGGIHSDTARPAAPATTVTVGGDEHLRRSLMAELTRQLGQAPNFGQIQPLETAVDRAETPYLYVEVSRYDILWTPVYGRANLVIKVAYAANGDVSFRHTEPTEFHFEGQLPSLKSSGKYTFSDVSWGIMSLPGYQDFLAGQIATAILSDL
jgi:hypothetical protein